MKKFLKNLLLLNPWSEFEIISQEVPWITLFKKCSQNFDPSKNIAATGGGGGGGGLFALYGHEEILKKSFSPKPQYRIWNNFATLFLV